jgi:hypothetical protein
MVVNGAESAAWVTCSVSWARSPQLSVNATHLKNLPHLSCFEGLGAENNDEFGDCPFFGNRLPSRSLFVSLRHPDNGKRHIVARSTLAPGSSLVNDSLLHARDRQSRRRAHDVAESVNTEQLRSAGNGIYPGVGAAIGSLS